MGNNINHIPNTQIRQILLIVLISVLFGLIFINLKFFLPALLGAYTFYVIMAGPLKYMVFKWGMNKSIASALLMLLSFIIILLPINGMIQLLQGQLANSFNGSEDILKMIERMLGELEERINIKILSPDSIKSISEWGIIQVRSLVDATLGGILIIIVMYFILWFMLRQGHKMEEMFFNSLPLRPENVPYLRKELNSLVYSNALGIPLMGIVQGVFAGVAYWLIGVPDVWFWALLTAIAGMMPIFGVALAYVPLSIVLYSHGHNGQAIFILLYGLIVIGSVDNIARMWLLDKIGHTHPLITLFGVIVGLKLFGFVGFIFGPIMISMFLLLIKIYEKEFGTRKSLE